MEASHTQKKVATSKAVPASPRESATKTTTTGAKGNQNDSGNVTEAKTKHERTVRKPAPVVAEEQTLSPRTSTSTCIDSEMHEPPWAELS